MIWFLKVVFLFLSMALLFYSNRYPNRPLITDQWPHIVLKTSLGTIQLRKGTKIQLLIWLIPTAIFRKWKYKKQCRIRTLLTYVLWGVSKSSCLISTLFSYFMTVTEYQVFRDDIAMTKTHILALLFSELTTKGEQLTFSLLVSRDHTHLFNKKRLFNLKFQSPNSNLSLHYNLVI